MYALPPLTVLDEFLGAELIQIWLDPYGIRFLLSNQMQVYSELSITQAEPKGTIWRYECVSHDGAPILVHRLIQKNVILVSREDLCVTFRFNDGSDLVVHSDIGPYEAGHMIGKDGSFTIF